MAADGTSPPPVEAYEASCKHKDADAEPYQDSYRASPLVGDGIGSARSGSGRVA